VRINEWKISFVILNAQLAMEFIFAIFDFRLANNVPIQYRYLTITIQGMNGRMPGSSEQDVLSHK